MYLHIPSMPWEGLKNRGCKTHTSRAKHGHAHVTNIDMLTLQFTIPAACPCADHHAFKKHLACSCCSQSHCHSDIGLLTHDISDFGKDSGHYSCHSVKCNISKGLRRIFRGYTYKAHALLGWIKKDKFIAPICCP